LIDDVSLVDEAGQCPLCSSLGGELVANGDFSAGNIGFSSDYIYQSADSTMTPTEYVINTEAGKYTLAWEGKDHTTGNGNYFFCSGLTSGPNAAWSETITISPNTNYVFSAWMNNILWSGYNYADPVLELVINDSLIARPVILLKTPMNG